jgi:Ca2+-binding RTX toxin-like protein
MSFFRTPRDLLGRPRAGAGIVALAIGAALAAPTASLASTAGFDQQGRLWVVGTGNEENKVTIKLDPDTANLLVSDLAGVVPGLDCLEIDPLDVTCSATETIEVTLGAGDDVLSTRTTYPGALPAGVRMIVDGGAGNDTLVAGPGTDRVVGGKGKDVLAGEGGDDDLVGGPGRDGLIGFAGNDLIDGGPGADAAFGFGGADVISGGGGSDTLRGGSGDDRLLGGFRHDLLRGGKGVDSLLGQEGPDRLLARDHRRDRRINCGPGGTKHQSAIVDKIDPPAKGC